LSKTMSDVLIELLESVSIENHAWAKGSRGRLVRVIDEDTWDVELPCPDGRSSRVQVKVEQVRIPVRSVG